MVSKGGLFHLPINGIYWGYNPLILTIDPNFLGHPRLGILLGSKNWFAKWLLLLVATIMGCPVENGWRYTKIRECFGRLGSFNTSMICVRERGLYPDAPAVWDGMYLR